MARANPQNTQAQMNLAASLQALGGVQSELTQTAEALKSVREALAIRQALLKADPKNLQRLVGVAATEVALGTVEWNAGTYADGARRWNQALVRLDAAVQADPQDNGLLYQSAFQERAVATAYAEAGLWDATARHLPGCSSGSRPITSPKCGVSTPTCGCCKGTRKATASTAPGW